MKLFLLGVPFWLWGIAFGATLAQEENEGPKQETVQLPQGMPEFIVIFSIPADSNNDDCRIDLRCVLRDENEYAAVAKAMRVLMNTLPSHISAKAKFIEVAVKRPLGDPKDKQK